MSAARPAVATSSRYERLVDRWIDVTSWPTSRKSALVAGLLLPLQAALSGLAWLQLRRVPGLVDADLVITFLLAWLVPVALVFVAALVASRARREARWTGYALSSVYCGFVASLLHLHGTLTTPFFAIYTGTVFLAALFFDRRLGTFTFVVLSAAVAAWALLELAGLVPYAPALRQRSLDGQLHAAWLPAALAIVFGVTLFELTLVQFSESARRSQQQHLSLAYAALSRTQARLERANALIRRYVPGQLAAKILDGSYDGARRPERRKLTLFFSDVAGFTAAADQMEPEDLAQLLNEYLAEMTAIAERFGATVNQFVGDGIMAFFGAPDATSDRDHALRCVRMALAMQARMRVLAKRWYEGGIVDPFRIRIGVNTGVASVGDFGSEGRITYSAIGNQTNLTARVQAACAPGRVLVTHTTWALVKDAIPCSEQGEIEVKGLHYPVRVYEVADPKAD